LIGTLGAFTKAGRPEECEIGYSIEQRDRAYVSVDSGFDPGDGKVWDGL
jgi:hypothetical protein